MLIMFHFESEKELQQTLLQCKQAALQALSYYQLDWEQIRFNQLSGTCTFVLETQEKQSYCFEFIQEWIYRRLNLNYYSLNLFMQTVI